MAGAAERAIKARLAGEGYAGIVKAAEAIPKKKVKPKPKPKPKRKREPWVENLMTKIQELLYGEETYAGKKFPPTGRIK